MPSYKTDRKIRKKEEIMDYEVNGMLIEREETEQKDRVNVLLEYAKRIKEQKEEKEE